MNTKCWLATILLLAGLIGACRPRPTPSAGGDFAIYLLAGKRSVAGLSGADLRALQLEERPVLSRADITAYARATHEITLTAEAAARIEQLPIPGGGPGLPFVVCVGSERIYAGAFWSPLSSLSYDGIAIEVLPERRGPLRIQLGYPESPAFFRGVDLRADPRILQALDQAGVPG